jgi:hypothetical protein
MNRDQFYLRRGDVREWVSCVQLAHLSPTSPQCIHGFATTELSLSGMIFCCDRLGAFFYGESSQDLRAITPVPPDLSEVIIEAWHTNDGRSYTFEHSFRLYNVIVLDFKHNGDCACCCGGDAKIKFDKIEICEAAKRRVILLDETCWLSPEYLKESDENSRTVYEA